MTNNKAIELLDNLLGVVEDNHGSDYDKAIHMAIDALAADVVPMDFHDRCMEIEIQKRMNMVEVVRCKDCKYRNKEWYQDKRHKDGGYWLVCCENDAIAERIYGLAQDDDYCSYGEKKNG